MPSLLFTDALGEVLITSKAPRFGNWTPDRNPIGPRRFSLGAGVAHQFAFRWDYLATLELGNIPAAQLDRLLRLKAHVLDGGDVVVETGDVLSRTYTCGLAPETVPSWTLDRQAMEYTLSIALKNRAAVDMLCVYEGPALVLLPGAPIDAGAGWVFVRNVPAVRIADGGQTCLSDAAANVVRARNWVKSPVTGLWEPTFALENGSTNIVENGDFETDSAGAATNNAAVARDTTRALHGGASLKITTTNVGSSGAWFRKRDGTRFPVVAGVTYTFSAFLRGEVNEGKAITVGIEWKDAVGAPITTTVLNTALPRLWERSSLTATAPAGAAQASPILYTNGAQGVFDFWADLVQFEQLSFASSPIPTGLAAAARFNESLSLVRRIKPQAITAYGRFLPYYPYNSAFSLPAEQGVFALGTQYSGAADEAFFLDVHSTRSLRLFHGSNNTLVTASASITAFAGFTEFLAHLYDDGSVQLWAQAENGASIALARTAAKPFLAEAFKGDQINVGAREGGGLRGHHAFSAFKLAFGIRTLGEMRALR